MTNKFRRAARVSGVLTILTTLAACGGDSTGPDGGSNILSPGQGTPLTGTATLTLEGGSAGTENVLVLVDTGLTTGAAEFNYTVTTAGSGAPGAVSGPATALLPSMVRAAESAGSGEPMPDLSYGMRLNARSRALLRPKFAAARAAYAARSASTSGISRSLGLVAPQVGDIVKLNVQADSACSGAVLRAARVVAIGLHSILVADTLNPAGGFTDADYVRFAARFDTLVYPVDVDNFGTPGDVDQNQKIVLLFSTAVNALTAPGSKSYVAGFFYNRDLFPTTATADLPGCKGSNYSELFYLLAPDPTGTINGNKRSTGFVDSITTSVIAHEFQHLINASRRLYVTNAEDFEVTWLNEGLSHVAEELLFYREAGVSARQNLDTIALRSSARIRNAYNNDMASNAGRYREFLLSPSDNSPVRDDDSLATRGATWNLLRYLADRKGGTESATWQALVNNPKNGLTNLAATFGSDLGPRVRDWNVSHYTDDFVTGLPAEYTQASWNWHSVYKAVTTSGPPYPLQVKSLAAGSNTGKLIAGGAAYYRFSIPANGTATIALTAPTAIDARVVRIR